MAKNKQKQATSYSLVVKSPNRRSVDIGTWRSALRAADGGRVKQLYDLYDDLLVDGVLADAMQKRIDAVCNSPLTFTNAEGEEVEEVSALIESLAFERILTEVMKSRFYGRSAFELEFPSEGEIIAHAIPAKHISLATKSILLQDSDEKGVDYEGDPFLCVVGEERDFGLFLKTAPYVIYKRGGFGDWAQWTELFGMPQRIGKYNTYDPESRRLLEDAFEKAGSAPWVVIPKEAEVETKETSGGSGTSYNEFRQACNEELLITLLGQTMTTVQGERGARSLGEVHKEVEEGKNASDLRFVQRVLNTYLRPMLAARGYAVEGGKFTFPKAAEQLSVSDVVMLSDILPIPASYLHEKYAIPVPAEGEAIARRKAPPAPMGYAPEGDEQDEDTAPIENADFHPTHGGKRNFFLRLWDFFAAAPRQGGASMAMSGNVPTLPETATMEERLIAGVAKGEITKWSPELFEHISQQLVKAVQMGFKQPINNADLDFTYAAQDDAYITTMEMNLYRFSAGKTLAQVQALNQAFRESKSYEEFKQKGEKIVGQFNRWTKTEYDTALVCAEQASTYRRLKRQTKLYPYWEYRTVGDGNVRKEHSDLEGVTLPANDKRWNEIYPPNGWGCRCYVVPRMKYEVNDELIDISEKKVEDYQATSDWKMAKQQGWGVNRLDSAAVFTANQQYTRKFPQKAHKTIENLRYYDYGLESFGKKSANATALAPEAFSGDPMDWFIAHPTLTDYLGRNVTIKENVFRHHTTGSHAIRIPLISAIQDVLSNPDEVWINSDKTIGDSINYIKFYKGVAIDVICELANNGTEFRIKTWFDINPRPNLKEKPTPSKRNLDPRWKYRRGLLIKNRRKQ